ncbi:hypothetical protein CHARACLAT_001157 [Characodon lateralis]|uniref:Uncharacterized protein n=1 Tax=Characodon lateralis TaxID=208331 RepID=A0ABU7DF95_9TELE|nr:hypothetical protein [Characodon lateralis]
MRVGYTSEGNGCAGTNFTQNVDQTDTQHSLVYCSLIRNIFLPWLDWQSPASHPLHMAQALSELIKRRFFTSPDAREKKEKKRGREEKSQKGAYCSLFTLVFW